MSCRSSPPPRFWHTALQPGASTAAFSMPPRTPGVTPWQPGHSHRWPSSAPAGGPSPASRAGVGDCLPLGVRPLLRVLWRRLRAPHQVPPAYSALQQRATASSLPPPEFFKHRASLARDTCGFCTSPFFFSVKRAVTLKGTNANEK